MNPLDRLAYDPKFSVWRIRNRFLRALAMWVSVLVALPIYLAWLVVKGFGLRRLPRHHRPYLRRVVRRGEVPPLAALAADQPRPRGPGDAVVSPLDTFRAELLRLLPHVSHWVLEFEDCGPAKVAVRDIRFPAGLGYAYCGNRLRRPPADLADRLAQYIDGMVRR